MKIEQMGDRELLNATYRKLRQGVTWLALIFLLQLFQTCGEIVQRIPQ